MYKVTAIIPAYNEEKRVFQVIKTLIESKLLEEIVCVNDGSTDNTLKEIKKCNYIKIINLKENHGKAYAIAKGIQAASNEIVTFIDADLQGLNDYAIQQLINPLISKKYDATIGYPMANNLDRFFIPISGNRAYFKKDLMPYLEQFKKKGYGLELHLNYLFRNKKIKLCTLKGVSNTLKHDKQPYDIATKQIMIEMFDIFSEIVQQKNPLSYLIESYLFPFYLKKQKKNRLYVIKLIDHLKNNIIKTFKS